MIWCSSTVRTNVMHRVPGPAFRRKKQKEGVAESGMQTAEIGRPNQSREEGEGEDTGIEGGGRGVNLYADNTRS